MKTYDKKIDNFLFEDNIKRYFLKDMLIRRKALEELKIKEIDSLVRDINVLFSNLNSNFKDNKKMIHVSDNNNWEGDDLFRNIVLHNVLDIVPKYGGTVKDFKETLLARWKNEKER